MSKRSKTMDFNEGIQRSSRPLFVSLVQDVTGKLRIGSSDPGGGGKKHEIYVAAFGSHLFTIHNEVVERVHSERLS